jgi:hypothetical protein
MNPETLVNINGKKHWLHVICTDKVTFLFPHETRGLKANHAMLIKGTTIVFDLSI